jgi:hypothetical protein
MGLLDNNKVKLQVKFDILASSVAPTASTKSWNINCKGFSTLSLLITSENGASTLAFKKKVGTSAVLGYAYFDVYTRGFANPAVQKSNSVNFIQGSGEFAHIDVSDCDTIQVVKSDSTATTTIRYALTQFPINAQEFLSPALSDVITPLGTMNTKLAAIESALSTGTNAKLSEIQTTVNSILNRPAMQTLASNIADIDWRKIDTLDCAGVLLRISCTAGVPQKLQLRKMKAGAFTSVFAVGVMGYINGGLPFAQMANNVYLSGYTSIYYIYVDASDCDYIGIKKTAAADAITQIGYSKIYEKVNLPKTYCYTIYANSQTIGSLGLSAQIEDCAFGGTMRASIVVTAGTFKFNVLLNNAGTNFYISQNGGQWEERVSTSGTFIPLSSGNYVILAKGNSTFSKDTDSSSASYNANVYFSPVDFNSLGYAGLVASQKNVYVSNELLSVDIPPKVDTRKTELLANVGDFAIREYDFTENGMKLGAVWENIAAFYDDTHIYISNDGIGGATTAVELTTANGNFPGLITGSTIKRLMIVPYERQLTSESVHYYGSSWRLVVFTSNQQIYHNFPSRYDTYDGALLTNYEYLFDESVIWDLPDRVNPVKTNTGDDATLIATGKYKYIPCLPDHMYEMHPAINQASPYGNTGFGATRTYTDGVSNTTATRARFFVPVRGFDEADSFRWMSGCIQNKQMSAIATYIGSTGFMGRVVVFTTNNGREWFAQYEYGPNGTAIHPYNDTIVASNEPWASFAEYRDAETNRIRFGTNSMSDSTAFVLKERRAFTPSQYDKEPESQVEGHVGKRFDYKSAINISSIVSSTDEGIVVTTASAHGLSNGAVIVIEKVGDGVSAWNWLCAEGHDDNQAGNGTIWKAQVLSSTTFRLMLEIKNPNNNLQVRHIHALNQAKDGIVIACGEEWPYGWLEFLKKPGVDAFSNSFAGNTYPIIRLTSNKHSIQRTLGAEFVQEGIDSLVYFGADTDYVKLDNAAMPSGRETTMLRSSIGVFKAKLSDVDDYDSCECIYNPTEACYFFRVINGVMIYVGQCGLIALSKDWGKNWNTYRLPFKFGMCWPLGVTNQNGIVLRYMADGVSKAIIIY